MSQQHNKKTVSPVRKDITAGIVGYLTTVYIVAVNSSILSDAGISVQNGMIATILASVIGCLLLGLWANAPMILIPGMGVNALFAYSIVQGSGLSFQEGLGVVLVSSLLFIVVANTRMASWLQSAIPDALKHAITVGLGFFLTLIGLEKGGIVVRGEHALVELGSFTSPTVIVSLLTLAIGVFLFVKNIPGHFLITMISGTALAYFFGILEGNSTGLITSDIQWVFTPSLSAIDEIAFWMSVFPLTIVLVFENMGLLNGQLAMLKQPEKFKRSFQTTSFSALTCAFFGTSPTVSSAESAAVIASDGKTGKASITTGLLFLLTIGFIPLITWIPSVAVSPILIIVGALMVQNIRHISLEDISEAIPAFFIMAMIPFTYSIADGMAFGFIAYPIVKFAIGKRKEISVPIVIIACLFLAEFVFKAIGH
ncbi:NCS2 family permease [Pontibacillus yanchengensis]|uniref:NCS2 family permease n=2 Tax=Pontibacillus yanchengensis TaxID=462910 RepID=A0ACC7VA15_9BACI|nr:NCS2 family permease [Pontibacillus yanchengensis]MYL33102.1 NCS2 family permease [Pontibacillus yanchengensis]MYL52048.1 NCS2 family permease [Pontibacillus yanchengensis]